MREWFIENLYSNIFTMITVGISCFVSYIISFLFYHFGNRNNLRMSLVYPIKREINKDRIQRKIFKIITETSSNYSSRYLYPSERRIINHLVDMYGIVSSYNENRVNAESLFSYFLYTLEKNGIKTKIVPIVVGNEIIDMELPPEMNYMIYDIEHNLKRNFYYEWDDSTEIEKVIASIFKMYCVKNYTDDSINYFEDYSFSDVLNKSEIRAKWNLYFKEYEESKKAFLNMSIAKD